MFELLYEAFILILAVGLIIFSVICLGVGVDILRAPRHLYQRNMRATQLAMKFNEGLLSASEHVILDRYVREGILEIRLAGVSKENVWVMRARLTEDSLSDISSNPRTTGSYY